MWSHFLPSPTTSILTGEGWVQELLSGHLEHIHCELGVHQIVFLALISDFWQIRHKNSRHVSLEEQLAIFLYMCVTGLSTRHVGEHFCYDLFLFPLPCITSTTTPRHQYLISMDLSHLQYDSSSFPRLPWPSTLSLSHTYPPSPIGW